MIYRVIQRALVREQPNVFAKVVRALPTGREFAGFPAKDPAWIARTIGGYVARNQVVEVGG